MTSGSSSSSMPMMAPHHGFSAPPPVPSGQSPLRNFNMAFHPSCYFSTSYQRNNKSNGQKNLRCFPGHCFEGHRTGWCGHPLIVRCKGGSQNLRLVGMFSPKSDTAGGEDEIASRSRSKFTLGAILTKKELDDNLRAGLLAECMEGFVEDVPRECTIKRLAWEKEHQRVAPPEGCDREFVFNSKSKGWHYGFLGSKKDSNVWHHWSVFALEASDKNPDLYTVVARLDSPAFQLFCRRRNRGPLAKARMDAWEEISAVDSKCIYPDSTPDEIATAVPTSVDQASSPSMKKRTPRKRAAETNPASSDSSASSSVTSMSSPNSGLSKKMKHPLYTTTIPSSPVSSALSSARPSFAHMLPHNFEQDQRMEMLLDLIRRVQLPGLSQYGPTNIAAAARRSAHAALTLVMGQDSVEFGNKVLKFAKYWKNMDSRGIPPPIHHAHALVQQSQPDDITPSFANFMLSQPEFAELIMGLVSYTEVPKDSPNAQALRATDRMLWILQRQVITVQRMRNEMRMSSVLPAPSNWNSVVPSQTPSSPIPSNGPPFLSLQQDLLPSSPILGFSGLQMTPFLVNQIHQRRRMGSNTSTGSDPSVMMTDFDLDWFSKSLDALHADGGAHTL